MAIRWVVGALEQTDPVLLRRFEQFRTICLAAATLLITIVLVAQFFPGLHIATRPSMPAKTVLVTLLLLIGMPLAWEKNSGLWWRMGIALAAMAALLSLVELIRGLASGPIIYQLLFSGGTPAPHPDGMPAQAAFAFFLLSIVTLLALAEKGIPSLIADLFALALFTFVFSLLSRTGYAMAGIFPDTVKEAMHASVLAEVSLLSLAALAKRCDQGVFRILLAPGLAGRTARVLTPLLIVLPFVREGVRERLMLVHHVSEHAVAAVFGSTAASISVLLLITVTIYMGRMEREIHNLGLRDELTGLYNLRGFQVLASQALRMAQRSNLPFSLMFLDVDDLKQINDGIGHGAGSALLVDTANLLRGNFRETDVVARIGGDEFVVAGQFTEMAIMEAAIRLSDQASATRVHGSDGTTVSFSIGHVTAAPGETRTLQEMLDEADAAMYEQKRRKKVQVY